MKKLFAPVIILLVFVMTIPACQKNKSSGIAVSDVMARVEATAGFEDPLREDITMPETAEKYGISGQDVREGLVLESSEKNSADIVILVRAKNDDAVLKLERALAAKAAGLTNAFEKDSEQRDKIESSVLKTRDDYVILIVCGNPEDIEKIFDEMI